MKISRRRIYKLKQQYNDEDFIPGRKDPGRKKKPPVPEFERIILDAYQIYKSGPVIPVSLNPDDRETSETGFPEKIAV